MNIFQAYSIQKSQHTYLVFSQSQPHASKTEPNAAQYTEQRVNITPQKDDIYNVVSEYLCTHLRKNTRAQY